MTVSTVSLTLTTIQISVQSASNQPVQDYKALQSALKSGDLSGAQTAFAALQKDLQPSSQTGQASSAAGQGTQMSQGGKDLEALANALSSGDLSGAQQAFASLQQDMQATGQVRRHHHHHHAGSGNSSTQASQGSSKSEPDTQISQGAKDLEALQSSLNSGDLTGAQQAFASLQQDLQSTSRAGHHDRRQSATDNTTTPTAGATSTAGGSTSTSQGANAFQTLQTALTSGDLAGAQQAFASLQQDLQTIGRIGHHHHHHGVGSVSSTTQPVSNTTPAVNSTTSSAAATATVSNALDAQA